jgi:uncharacterized protein (TIGR02453 family)
VSPTATTTDRLPPAALAFLEDLAAHNDRAWFEENRARCEADLYEPARALVRDVVARLAKAFPRVTGSDAKTGGSLTRLHRDVRFAKDGRPFHSHLGMHFWHEKGKKMEVPGFFVRIDPAEVTVATGMHGPEPEDLARIRRAIDADREGWAKAAHGAAFRKAWGGLEGETLKRVPAPFPADHPHAQDLRRKDLTAFARWKAVEATRPGFSARLVEQWRTSKALLAFLCRALRLPW